MVEKRTGTEVESMVEKDRDRGETMIEKRTGTETEIEIEPGRKIT